MHGTNIDVVLPPVLIPHTHAGAQQIPQRNQKPGIV